MVNSYSFYDILWYFMIFYVWLAKGSCQKLSELLCIFVLFCVEHNLFQTVPIIAYLCHSVPRSLQMHIHTPNISNDFPRFSKSGQGLTENYRDGSFWIISERSLRWKMLKTCKSESEHIRTYQNCIAMHCYYLLLLFCNMSNIVWLCLTLVQSAWISIVWTTLNNSMSNKSVVFGRFRQYSVVHSRSLFTSLHCISLLSGHFRTLAGAIWGHLGPTRSYQCRYVPTWTVPRCTKLCRPWQILEGSGRWTYVNIG